jgi:hypothetical protein
VPGHYRHGLLENVEAALAEAVLRHPPGARLTLGLEIELGSRGGRLEIDTSGFDAESLKHWALRQWNAKQGEGN